MKETVMKKFFLFFVSIFLVAVVHAQTVSGVNNQVGELPSLILERDWLHFTKGILFNQYQQIDGTLLKYKNVRAIIYVVPENENV
jgi:hypothetical protein